MEPNDLLDVPGEPPPGPDELRAIAARAGKYRWRVVAAGAALALVAGGGIGYAVSNHGTHPAQTVVASGGTPASQTSGGAAASQPATGLPDTSPQVGAAFPSSEFPAKYKKLFTRTAGDTDIRAFTATFASLYSPSCLQGAPQASMVVEASNLAAVGTINAPPDSSPLTGSDFSATGEAFGVPEGEPTEIVIVHSAVGVGKVTADVPAGKVVDEMAPVDGWSALALPIPSSVAGAKADSSFGTIELLTAAGKVVTTSPVTFGDWGTSTGSSTVVPPAVSSGSASSSGAVSGSSGLAGAQVATPSYPCMCPTNAPTTGTHVLLPSCTCPPTALCACPAIARSNTAVNATCASTPPVTVPAPPSSGSGSVGGGSGSSGSGSTSGSSVSGSAGGSPPGIPPSNVSSGSSATTAGG